MRGSVLFPGNPTPLIIGRPFTIASIKAAIRDYQGQLVVTAQKAIEMNEAPDLKNVFSVGCLCKIENHVEFPDGSMKVIIVPLWRVQITDLKNQEDYRSCQIEIMPDLMSRHKMTSEEKEKIINAFSSAPDGEFVERFKHALERLKKEKEDYAFIMTAGSLLSLRYDGKKREPTLEQINQGIFIIDTYSTEEKSLINISLARIQEVLEAADINTALKKIEALA